MELDLFGCTSCTFRGIVGFVVFWYFLTSNFVVYLEALFQGWPQLSKLHFLDLGGTFWGL